MPMPTVAELIAAAGGSARSYFDKHSEPGDTITGTVTEVAVRQAVDIRTRKPLSWDDGTPRLQVVVQLQTTLDDGPDENGKPDDGLRSVFIKWWTHHRAAFLEACRDAGIDSLEPGDVFTATFDRLEKAAEKGLDDTKVFVYKVERPV